MSEQRQAADLGQDIGNEELERELGAAPRRGAGAEVEADVGELGAAVVHLVTWSSSDMAPATRGSSSAS